MTCVCKRERERKSFISEYSYTAVTKIKPSKEIMEAFCSVSHQDTGGYWTSQEHIRTHHRKSDFHAERLLVFLGNELDVDYNLDVNLL